MDLLSQLLGIIGQHPGQTQQRPQQQPSAPASQLPNKNQIPIGATFNPYSPVGGFQIGNVDKPQSIPKYQGGNPYRSIGNRSVVDTPQVQFFTDPDGTRYMRNYDMIRNGASEEQYDTTIRPTTLPDHLSTIPSGGAIAVPTKGRDLLYNLTRGHSGSV